MNMRNDPAYQQWVSDAKAVTVAQAIASYPNAALKRHGQELVGPCPSCGGTDRFAIHIKKGIWHCRGSKRGGDSIALVQYLDGCDFTTAVEKLAGRPPPAPPTKPKPKPSKAKSRPAQQPQPSTGLTLAGYAAAKKLDIAFLKQIGLADFPYLSMPAVRIPYFGTSGHLLATRYRIALTGDKFRWKKGDKTQLYGLSRLDQARAAGHIVICEGESDAHTLWQHDIPAIAVPGAGLWNEDRDARHFEGIDDIIVVIEADTGGEAMKRWLATSSIRDRVRMLTFNSWKDLNEFYQADPASFRNNWNAVTARSRTLPWPVYAETIENEVRKKAFNECGRLASDPDILARFAADLRASGVTGEEETAKVLFLALVSRVFDRPVSVAVKGPSSGGKSFLVEMVTKFFPSSVVYALSSMSERALAYSQEPLKHRFLVLYEAAGMARDFTAYMLRSLLSEGRLRYETVEKTATGLQPRLIEREGPTGLIVTTTETLHAENETRMLSLTVSDTPEQTKAILRTIATQRKPVDMKEWHALATWLEAGPREVVIPFAERLADLIDPAAVRLRRDFRALLTLIEAHAVLHQASRQRDGSAIVATVADDYEAIRELVADALAQGVEATVSKEIRETVEAVKKLIWKSEDTATVAQLAKALKIDRSAAHRRVTGALDLGYIKDVAKGGRGTAKQLVIGDPMPGEGQILPLGSALEVET